MRENIYLRNMGVGALVVGSALCCILIAIVIEIQERI